MDNQVYFNFGGLDKQELEEKKKFMVSKICNFLIIPFIKFNIKIVKILNLL